MKLRSGIPKIKEYKQVLKSNLFMDIEKFSNEFINFNKTFLKKYKWAKDPFHQWSRQWEYPFVFYYINNYIKNNKNIISILDLGSGITFFPYYIASKFNDAKIFCCDFDNSLIELFNHINLEYDYNTNFVVSDIFNLPYFDNYFDIIYSISVLEHLNPLEYDHLIQEVKRVLKKEGIFIISFDISIDRKRQLSFEIAKRLIKLLEMHFKQIDIESNKCFEYLIKAEKEIVTTNYVKGINKNLLPWKLTFLTKTKFFFKNLLKFKIRKELFYNLTFFCSIYKKS